MRPNILPDKMAEWFRNLSNEQIREVTEQARKQVDEDWNHFVTFFNKGICGLCEKPLKSFSENSPCLHWLLRPKKFKKKHFPLLCRQFSYFRISAYVRWVASIENPVTNINDIKKEHPGDKLIDFTAKYKHIMWSFSCSKSDLEGHVKTKEGNLPHYHFRMNLDDNAFIRYSDFHIPFHDDDLYELELIKKHGDVYNHSDGRSIGLEIFLGTEEGKKLVIEKSTPTDTYEDAAFRLQTLVMALDGETISEKMIVEAQSEARSSGKTIASVLREKVPNANIMTVVSAGTGVPEAHQRSGRKRKKNRYAFNPDAE